ncbi:MAG: hypothetical protein U0795_09635 [Pirellulales bacterium]
MRADRHIGVVILFDSLAAYRGQVGAAPNVGDVRARVLRWVQHGGIPATFAVADPLNNPWAAAIQSSPRAELALAVEGCGRASWQRAAERLEASRDASLELTSALIVGDQLPARERRPIGVDIWAYWKPTHDLQIPVQPWQDKDGWQIPLRAWSEPRGGRSSTGWWRPGQVNWSSQLPPVGRRYSWILPVMSYSASQLQSCEALFKQLATWSRQGLVALETLSQTVYSLQSQAQPASQRSILRAA